jgi:hypothetical protein
VTRVAWEDHSSRHRRDHDYVHQRRTSQALTARFVPLTAACRYGHELHGRSRALGDDISREADEHGITPEEISAHGLTGWRSLGGRDGWTCGALKSPRVIEAPKEANEGAGRKAAKGAGFAGRKDAKGAGLEGNEGAGRKAAKGAGSSRDTRARSMPLNRTQKAAGESTTWGR